MKRPDGGFQKPGCAPKRKRPPYNLFYSFGFAFRGIFCALARERNLRIHFAAGAFALFFAIRYYRLATGEMALLCLCIGFVLACEMVNTAIEATVDLESPSYSALARIAKDAAAGAVLVSAVTSVAVGFFLFWDVPTLTRISADFLARPLPWMGAAAAALGWILLPRSRT